MKKKAKQFILGVMAALLLLALTGCGEQEKYDEAMELYNAGDYRAAANIFEELGAYEDSATRLQSCEYELTTDRQFIHALSKGLHERWLLVNQNSETAVTVTVNGEELSVGGAYTMDVLIEAELDDLIEYKTAVFEDKELQEKALAYITALEKGVEAEKYANVDFTKYSEMTDEVYAERAVLLWDFYNNYDLPVAAEDATVMKGLLDAAAAVLAQQQKEEEIKDLFVNNFKYTTETEALDYAGYIIKVNYTFENTSSYDIDNLYAEFNYFDDNGYKTNYMTNLGDDIHAGDNLRGETDIYMTDFDTAPTGTVKMTDLHFWVDDITFKDAQKWFE